MFPWKKVRLYFAFQDARLFEGSCLAAARRLSARPSQDLWSLYFGLELVRTFATLKSEREGFAGFKSASRSWVVT